MNVQTKRANRIAAAVAMGVCAFGLRAATTIYPVGDDTTSTDWLDPADPENWTLVKGSTGDYPTAANLKAGIYSPELERKVNWNLGGGSVWFSYIRNTGGSYYGNKDHSWAFSNGTIRLSFDFRERHKGGAGTEICQGATLQVDSYYQPGNNMGESDASPLWIRSGGRMTVSEYAPYNGKLYVDEGGVFKADHLTPVSSSAQSLNRFENSGTTTFDSGLVFLPGECSLSGDGGTGYKFTFCQKAGDLHLGGDVSRGNAVKAAYDFVFSGGAIHVNRNSFGFYNGVNASVPDGSTVTLDMAEGTTADFSSVTFGENTTLVLTRRINIIYGASRPTAVKLLTQRYVYTGVPAEPVVGAEGFQLTLAAPLMSLENLTLPNDWTLTLDQLAFTDGSVVAELSDAAFLETVYEKLAADLYASYPNMTVSIVGNQVKLAAQSVTPATYYWNLGNRGDKIQGDVAMLSNWSTAWDDAAGKPSATAVPSRLPTAEDTLCVTRDLIWNLGGRTVCVKDMELTPYPYSSGAYWGAATDSWSVSNGTLFVKNRIYTRHKASKNGVIYSSFDICDGGRLVHGDEGTTTTFYAGEGCAAADNGVSYLRVFSGGEALIRSHLRFYSTYLQIMPGGCLTCRRVSFAGASEQPNFVENNGLCVFPDGLVMEPGLGPAASGKASLAYRQCGGTMTLGGNVATNEKPGSVTFELSGGTLEATENVAFHIHSATVPADSSATLKVAANKLLDMTGFSYGENVVLTKTGAGCVAFDPVAYPSSLVVNEGYLAMTHPNMTPPSSVTFAAGAGLHFAAVGTILPPLPNAADMSFTVDTDVVPEGGVIATCTDVVTLAAVRDVLNAAWIAIDPDYGFRATIVGNNLVLEKRRRGLMLMVR